MSMRYYISTQEAPFFVNNSMGYAENVPTTGNYKVGDFIISSKQEDGIFGWVCTVAGTPGEWEVIGSGFSGGGGVAGSTRVVGYYNTVEFSDTRTSVEIGIEGFDNNNDFLEVHYNGLLLAKDVHYSVSEDGLRINAIGEVWNENADDTQSMTFRVLKSEGLKLKKLSNIVSIDAPTTEVVMGIAGVTSSDIVEVHLNGVLLVEGLDYAIESGTLIKLDKSEAWNPYSVPGQKMFIDVFKNISTVIEPENGSVTMDKLAPEVVRELGAVEGILNTVNIQTNSINNLNEKVEKLESDIGDVDFSEVESKIGELNSLNTSAKGNLVAAINELFQNANNGKQLIASAIGEPLVSTDTFSAMSNSINSLLSTFKTNMMNNGIAVESTDKFKQLIDKITTLKDNEGKGIQFVEAHLEDSVYVSGSATTRTYMFSDLGINFTPTFLIFGNKDTGPLLINSGSHGLVSYTIKKIDGGFTVGYTTGGSSTTNVKDLKCYAIGVGEEDTSLRDSFASILEGNGVEVTEEDDMASLIGKVDEKLDHKDRQLECIFNAVGINADLTFNELIDIIDYMIYENASVAISGNETTLVAPKSVTGNYSSATSSVVIPSTTFKVNSLTMLVDIREGTYVEAYGWATLKIDLYRSGTLVKTIFNQSGLGNETKQIPIKATEFEVGDTLQATVSGTKGATKVSSIGLTYRLLKV